MEEMQQQIVTWCVALKDYLKCEQCQGKLSLDIYLCEAGHLVCSSCLQESTTKICTVCKLPLTRTRNYLAENLAQKMDDILDKIGINNETDDLESVCSESNASWRMFPCWMGKCRFQGTPEDMRQHCKDTHRSFFETIINNQFPISRSWNFQYSFPRTLNRFFDVTDLGMFLLHIIIYDNGALRAYVFMYTSGRAARNYKYQLKVSCAEENLSFEGDVDCARIPRNQLAKKGLFIPRAQNLQVQLQNIQKFTVSIEITRNIKNQENLPERVEKKNQYKNRRKTQKARENAQEKVESSANLGTIQKSPEEPQHKPANKQNKNYNNNLQKNHQKPVDSDGKNNNQKPKIIEKSQDSHNNQSKVDNCLQTTDPSQKFIPLQSPGFSQSSIPPLFPGVDTMHQYGGHSGLNYPQNFYQGTNHGPFNPHIPPATPGPSATYYNTPASSTYNNQPSAPVEDHFQTVQYPDLTPMKQGMKNDRLDELQQKINEKERARQSPRVYFGENSLESGGRRAKDKDKCSIS